jgi:hypothetical protein
MTRQYDQEIEKRLLAVLRELQGQPTVGTFYSDRQLPFADHMRDLSEYIEVAGEYEIAYESIVSTLSAHPYVLSGAGAVALLEVGLLFGYKTTLKEDALFDRR